MSETMMNAAMAIASIATRTASSRSRLAKPPIVSSRENLKKPMIVSTADGKFYISNSQTTTRTSNGMTYNVIIKSTSLAGSKKQQIEAYKKYIPSDPKDCFDNLNDAYAAYEKLVKSNPDYQKYENTLPY